MAAQSYWNSFLSVVDGARQRLEESAEETRKRLAEANTQISATVAPKLEDLKATVAPKIEDLKASTASVTTASLNALGDLKERSASALGDLSAKSATALGDLKEASSSALESSSSYLGELPAKSAALLDDVSRSVSSSTTALYQATPTWEEVSKKSQLAKEKIVGAIDLQHTAEQLKNAAVSTQMAMKTTLELVGSKVAPSMEELKIKTAVSTRNASTKAIESLAQIGDKIKADSDAQLEATLGITPFTEKPQESFYRENYNAGIGLLSRNIHGLNILGRNNRALAARAEKAEVAVNNATYLTLQMERECAQLSEAVKSAANIRRDIDGVKTKLDNLLRRVVETEELLTKREALVSAQELEAQKRLLQHELKNYERQRDNEFQKMKEKVQEVKQRLFEEKNQQREEVMAPLKDEAREKLEVKVSRQLDEYAAYGFAVGPPQRKKRASRGPTLEEVSLEKDETGGDDDLDSFLSDAPESVHDLGIPDDDQLESTPAPPSGAGAGAKDDEK